MIEINEKTHPELYKKLEPIIKTNLVPHYDTLRLYMDPSDKKQLNLLVEFLYLLEISVFRSQERIQNVENIEDINSNEFKAYKKKIVAIKKDMSQSIDLTDLSGLATLTNIENILQLYPDLFLTISEKIREMTDKIAENVVVFPDQSKKSSDDIGSGAVA